MERVWQGWFAAEADSAIVSLEFREDHSIVWQLMKRDGRITGLVSTFGSQETPRIQATISSLSCFSS